MNRKIFFFIFLVHSCLFVFNSCGLEDYVVLDEPTRISGPELSSISQETDYSECTFKFVTSESAVNNRKYATDASLYRFMGTAVFYRIYKTYSQMSSDNTTISSKLSSSTAKYTTADYLKDTLNYQQLGLNGEDVSPFIDENNFGDEKYANKTIWIRLSCYGTEEQFQAAAYYVKSTEDKTLLGIPTRAGGKGLTFDFGRTSEDEDKNKIPVSDDSDVNSSGTEDSEYEHCWYVQLYAATMLQDQNYVTTFSPVEFLGSVKIKDDSKDN